MRGMLGILLCVAVALTAMPVHAQDKRPPPPPADMLASPGNPGWSVDDRTGCWLWILNPQPGATVTWSGGCGADGRATGRGVQEWRWDGKTERYEGDLRDGKLHGRGKLVRSDGGQYEGELRDDKAHGRGVDTGTYDSGVKYRYEGEWRDGKRHGRGKLVRSDGGQYEGDFAENKFHGRGTVVYSNGSRYEGEWRDDKRTGRGVFTWPNGVRYEGEWRDGRPDGFGEAWINGSRYLGNWAGGCFRDGDRKAVVGRELSECP